MKEGKVLIEDREDVNKIAELFVRRLPSKKGCRRWPPNQVFEEHPKRRRREGQKRETMLYFRIHSPLFPLQIGEAAR